MIQVAAQHGFIYETRKGHFYRKISDVFCDSLFVQYFPDKSKRDKVEIEVYIGVHIHRMYELICNLNEQPIENTNRFPQIRTNLSRLTGERYITYSINDDIEQFKERLDILFEKCFEPCYQDMHSWENIQKLILTRIYPYTIVSAMYYFNGKKKKGLKYAMKCLNSKGEYREPWDYAFVENFAKLPPYKGNFNIDMMK